MNREVICLDALVSSQESGRNIVKDPRTLLSSAKIILSTGCINNSVCRFLLQKKRTKQLKFSVDMLITSRTS
jgi:hypothetical protein